MKMHTGKVHEKDQKQNDGISSEYQSGSLAMPQFADNRPQASSDRMVQEMAGNSPQVKQLKSVQEMADKASQKQWAAGATQLKNGVSINDDRNLENEASRMGSRALTAGAQKSHAIAKSNKLEEANFSVEAPVQRLVTVDAGSHNYPVKKQSRSVKKDKSVPNDTSFFVSQDLTNADQGYSEGANGLEANLVFKSNANLMLSDALDLAIEADVEAKYFFATKARIREANTALKGGVRLRATDKYLKVTSNGGTLKLFQVEPYVPAKGDHGVGKSGAGLNMRIPQRCNEMSEFVSGKAGVEFSAGLQVYKILARVLDNLLRVDRDFEDEFKEVLKNIGTVNGNKAYGDLTEEMSVAYKNALDDGYEDVINQMLSLLGGNKYMDPSIGSSITTFGVGTENENALADKNATFGYHFGAVVAKSGSDYITLENYARRNEKSKGLLSGGDPLFFFRMYGVNSDADSWHQKALDTNAFVGRAISFVVD